MITGSPEDSLLVISYDVERLFNTAYCARIIAQYVHAYQETSITPPALGTPYLLSYLCLPLALHAATREEVNSHTVSYDFHRFIGKHPTLLIYLAERIQDYASLTQTSLLFGITHGLLEINLEMALVSSTREVVREINSLFRQEKEALQPIHAALRIGTWFSRLTVAEIFFYLGIHP